MLEPAPLTATSLAPVPPGAEPFWLNAYDGTRLRVARFSATAHPVRGSVMLSPGRTEPIEKYFEVISDLTARGFVVLCHDWRGQGLSQRLVTADPMKGAAKGWRAYIADYHHILESFGDQLPEPWIAMGHSMGGGLTLLALAEGEDRFAATILSAPMAGVQLGGRGRKSTLLAARLFGLIGQGDAYAIGPMDPFADTFDTQVLTHDAARWERWKSLIETRRDLALGGPTWSWLEFALDLSFRVEKSAAFDHLATPLVIVAASEERLVDNAAARAVAARAPKGRYLEVDGAYHEVLMETDSRRAQFFAQFDSLVEELHA
jgi:lysophospholipase